MKSTILLVLLTAIVMIVQAQPQAFKYQAVARNSSGDLLIGKSVTFKISILQGSSSGTMVYSELHSRTTNSFGLVDLEIGNGTSPSGSFAGINWGVSTYFLKVEMDPAGGINFQPMGTSQLLSVPYALHAKEVLNKDDADASPTNEIQTLSIAGNQLTLSKSGGSVTLPGNDNWGVQVVATDVTLSGNGTTSNPLKIPDGAITSAKIADGGVTSADLAANSVDASKIVDLSIGTSDLAGSSVTSAKIADGTIVTNDLADDAVTLAKISTSGAGTNKVLTYNGSEVVWEYGSGAMIKITILSPGCYSVASFSSSAYSKIADIGSFSKVDANSRMEISFNGRIWAQTMAGTGAHFELRVDNVATTVGRARATLKSDQAGGTGDWVNIEGVFTGSSIGSHTISIWVIGAGGSGTYGGIDPGCFNDGHMLVREIR